MSRALVTRGPDDSGFLQWAGQPPVQLSRELRPDQTCRVGLIHRRLSILDLSEAGWQPMGTQDQRHYIVFNGEIYNYLELRRELESLGYTLRSHSDTEVLLAAYVHWGTEALNRLVGMFAFGILDTQDNSLFLARDFFGIKPLYYTYWRDGFAFASEIKALLDLPGVSRQINPQRLYDYLCLGTTDLGEQTMFADVQQLPAAHYLHISLSDLRSAQPVRYWQVDLSSKADISFESAARQLRHLFLESVRLHLRSDVPVGAALSGGIDSSSIVMAMRHLASNVELHSFSYIADNPELSEERWVDIAGKQANVVIHKVQPTATELFADMDYLVYTQDEPFCNTIFYAQHRVFRLAREAGIKVILEGQAADELLGGYRHYLAARVASHLLQGHLFEGSRFALRIRKIPDVQMNYLLPRLAGLVLSPGFKAVVRWFIGNYRIPRWLNSMWFAEHGVVFRSLLERHGREALREQLHQTLTETYLPMLLRCGDRNSMAWSVESRVPFLTPALVNFVLSLPEQYIIAPDGTSKYVFRQAMRGLVPDPILDRQDKIGFDTPERNWLFSLHSWVDRVLQSETARQIPALNLHVVQQEWQAVLQGRKPFDSRIWRWINLILWARRYSLAF